MTRFKEFAERKQRLVEEEEVSVSLLRNLMDILRDFVESETKVSEDDQKQIIKNMKVSQESVNGGKTFTATSFYMEDDETKKEIEIKVEISSNIEAGDIEEEPVEAEPEPEEVEAEVEGGEEEEDEEVPESFEKFKEGKI